MKRRRTHAPGKAPAKTVRAKQATPRKKAAKKSDEWILRLYVAGRTARSVSALTNLTAICEAHLAGRYRIELIDLLKQPQLARGDQIIAVPTLVRHLPPPMKKIIGDLSNSENVLVGLDLRQRQRGRRAGEAS